MTNEELFNDLKQFIATTVSQEVAGLRTELKDDIKSLDQKVDAIQDAVAEALSQTNEALDATVQDHEQRLQRLEHRTA
ncbi:hypothetical protein OG738_03825 [Amycolatopsis sp. NBC_01488]|uniref:hypothetical protein n=1 Tax=Amycolatopsis sp. NBC_01488 TaxID=2903563 RepID=UPI002E2A2F2E|nr:hypothetical protein [Amycolatopsis sp. NBC_01488]